MRSHSRLGRLCVVFGMLVLFGGVAPASTPAQAQDTSLVYIPLVEYHKPPAIVSGLVTLDGEPVAGLLMLLVSQSPYEEIYVVTSEQGIYRFEVRDDATLANRCAFVEYRNGADGIRRMDTAEGVGERACFNVQPGTPPTEKPPMEIGFVQVLSPLPGQMLNLPADIAFQLRSHAGPHETYRAVVEYNTASGQSGDAKSESVAVPTSPAQIRCIIPKLDFDGTSQLATADIGFQFSNDWYTGASGTIANPAVGVQVPLGDTRPLCEE